MSNIYKLKHPLSDEIQNLLSKISQVCAELDFSFFIAGAMSREVLLTHVHGRRAGRHTRDIDIAVFIENWQQFRQFKDKLLQSGATEVPKNMHRFLWEGVELDIIPFGDIAEENKLLWPPDREIIMSVDGFTEAYTHATMVAISSHCQVKFCSLPGLLLLKLFAWRDRGNGSSKDAIDIYKIITEYQFVEESRLYDNDTWGESVEWAAERLGALLAGCDTAAIASTESLANIATLNKELLIDAIARQITSDRQEEIEILINDFWDGLNLTK